MSFVRMKWCMGDNFDKQHASEIYIIVETIIMMLPRTPMIKISILNQFIDRPGY